MPDPYSVDPAQERRQNLVLRQARRNLRRRQRICKHIWPAPISGRPAQGPNYCCLCSLTLAQLPAVQNPILIL